MHNTGDMLYANTHYQTAPFARAIYLTKATSVTVQAWTNVYGAQPNAAQISILANGEVIQAPHFIGDGPHEITVALPAGDKRVEIVAGGMRGVGSGNSNTPTLIGQGTFLKGVQFNASAMAVPRPDRTEGILIVGDSIANGSTLSSPNTESYPLLLQQMLGIPVSVLGRGGLALYDATVRVGEQLPKSADGAIQKLVREVIRFNPLVVIMTLGYNDYVKGFGSSTNVNNILRPEISLFAEQLSILRPSIIPVFTGMTPVLPGGSTRPISEYNNINSAMLNHLFIPGGANLPVAGVSPARLDWSAGVITTAQLNDYVHPNASAHEDMAEFLAGHFQNDYMIPTEFTESEITHGATITQIRLTSFGRLTLRNTPATTVYITDALSSNMWGADIERGPLQYTEMSLNDGPWTRIVGDVFFNDPHPSYNALRFRRLGGDGSIIHTVTITGP